MKSLVSNQVNRGSVSNKISILALVVFLISPLLSLPLIFYGIYYRERLGLFVLSLFGGILSFYLLPSWDLDLSRYYMIYDEISNGGWSGLMEVLNNHNDYVFFFIYYLFSLIGFKFQFVLFVLATLCYYSLLFIFDSIVKKFNYSKDVYFIWMLCFVLSLPILSLLSVTRFSLALTFFIIYIYHKLEGRNRKALLFLFISCITHFAFLVYVPFLLLFSVFKSKFKINTLLILLIIAVVFVSVFGGLLQYVSYIPIISDKILIYAEIYEDTKLPLLSFSLLLPVVLFVSFYFKNSKYLEYSLIQVFLSTLLIVLFTVPFNVIVYDRYVQVFKPIGVIAMVYGFYNLNISKNDKGKIRFLVFLLYFPFSLYYVYTFFAIYKDNFGGFISLGKFLLVSILSSTYTHYDFI